MAKPNFQLFVPPDIVSPPGGVGGVGGVGQTSKTKRWTQRLSTMSKKQWVAFLGIFVAVGGVVGWFVHKAFDEWKATYTRMIPRIGPGGAWVFVYDGASEFAGMFMEIVDKTMMGLTLQRGMKANVIKLDCRLHIDWCQQQNIKAVPRLYFYRNEKLVEEYEWTTEEDDTGEVEMRSLEEFAQKIKAV